MNENKEVLVTGGSGFLAGWCIVRLLEQGYRVRTTVRDLSRQEQVRRSIASQVDPADRLRFHAADLSRDEGWREAIAGCDAVLHVASPFPLVQPKDPDELVAPARDGALRVLRFASESGVRRVVLTSSIVAIGSPKGDARGPFTEADWTDPDKPGLSPYGRSKTIAERAAWDYVAKNSPATQLAVVNPAAILGPPLSLDLSTSLQIVSRLLDGKVPGLPRLSFCLVDVRDVADLHLLAMTSPQAAGQRYIAGGPSLWFAQIAQILKDRVGTDAANVPTRRLPDFVMRLVALFDPSVRSTVRDLGVQRQYLIDKARALGWTPRAVEDSIADTARGLLELRQQGR